MSTTIHPTHLESPTRDKVYQLKALKQDIWEKLSDSDLQIQGKLEYSKKYTHTFKTIRYIVQSRLIKARAAPPLSIAGCLVKSVIHDIHQSHAEAIGAWKDDEAILQVSCESCSKAVLGYTLTHLLIKLHDWKQRYIDDNASKSCLRVGQMRMELYKQVMNGLGKSEVPEAEETLTDLWPRLEDHGDGPSYHGLIAEWNILFEWFAARYPNCDELSGYLVLSDGSSKSTSVKDGDEQSEIESNSDEELRVTKFPSEKWVLRKIISSKKEGCDGMLYSCIGAEWKLRNRLPAYPRLLAEYSSDDSRDSVEVKVYEISEE